MTRAPEPYRRLPGTGNQMVSYVRLYVGADHLLQVSATGYSETYKRFFFRDIQVISLHETRTGMIWNTVWAGLTAFFALLAVSLGENGIVFAFFAGAWGCALVMNLASGRTCACYLQTAVQRQRLYSVRRLRRALRILNELKPLIASAQGEMSPEQLAARLRPTGALLNDVSAIPPVASR